MATIPAGFGDPYLAEAVNREPRRGSERRPLAGGRGVSQARARADLALFFLVNSAAWLVILILAVTQVEWMPS